MSRRITSEWRMAERSGGRGRIPDSRMADSRRNEPGMADSRMPDCGIMGSSLCVENGGWSRASDVAHGTSTRPVPEDGECREADERGQAGDEHDGRVRPGPVDPPAD